MLALADRTASVARPIRRIGETEPFNRERQAGGMNLTVIRIAMQIAMPCALVAVGAAGLFLVVRHMTWVG
jgi:hypothetical protein